MAKDITDITFGEFIDSVKKTDGNYVIIFIGWWETLLLGNKWKEYRQLPLTSNLIVGFAGYIASCYQGNIRSVGFYGKESYNSLIKEGHACLQKIYEISVGFGIKVNYNQINLPLTLPELLKAMGLAKES